MDIKENVINMCETLGGRVGENDFGDINCHIRDKDAFLEATKLTHFLPNKLHVYYKFTDETLLGQKEIQTEFTKSKIMGLEKDDVWSYIELKINPSDIKNIPKDKLKNLLLESAVSMERYLQDSGYSDAKCHPYYNDNLTKVSVFCSLEESDYHIDAKELVDNLDLAIEEGEDILLKKR